MEDFYPFVYENPIIDNFENQYLYIDDYQYQTTLIEEPEITVLVIEIF